MMFGKLTEEQFKSEIKRVFGDIDLQKVISTDEKNNDSGQIARRIKSLFEEKGDTFLPDEPVHIQGFNIEISMCAENALDKRLMVDGVNGNNSRFSFVNEEVLGFLVSMVMGEFTLRMENSQLHAKSWLSLNGDVYLKDTVIKSSRAARLDDVRIFDSVLDGAEFIISASHLESVKSYGPGGHVLSSRFSSLYKVEFSDYTVFEHSSVHGVLARQTALRYSCVSLTSGTFVDVKASHVCMKAEVIKANILDIMTVAEGKKYTTLLLTDNGPLVNDNYIEPRFATLANWYVDRVNDNKNFVTRKRNNDLYELMKTKTDMFDSARR